MVKMRFRLVISMLDTLSPVMLIFLTSIVRDKTVTTKKLLPFLLMKGFVRQKQFPVGMWLDKAIELVVSIGQ